MIFLLLTVSIVLLLAGHIFRVSRWRTLFLDVGEARTAISLFALTVGTLVNFLSIFYLGDLLRAVLYSKLSKTRFEHTLSAVFLDRLLDLVFLSCFLGYLISTTSKVYALAGIITATVTLVVMTILVANRNRYLDAAMNAIASIFNNQIRKTLLNCYWSLYLLSLNLIRCSRQLSFWLTSAGMWFCYFGSIAALTSSMKLAGQNVWFLRATGFLYLESFNRSPLMSVWLTDAENSIATFLIYLTLPLLVIIVYWSIKSGRRYENLNVAKLVPFLPDRAGENATLQIYQNPEDEIFFLNKFISGDEPEIARNYEMNRNVSVIRDLTSGSNATTWLIRDQESMKIRKFGFATAATPLQLQVEWLERMKDKIPVTKILSTRSEGEFFSYDMEYSNSSIPFFEFIHSAPIEKSKAVLEEIINRLDLGIYSDSKSAKSELIDLYLQNKFGANLTVIRNSLSVELTDAAELTINSKKVRNLSFFETRDFKTFFRSCFIDDREADIHGDLTIENIIFNAKTDLQAESWYLIDPNTKNIFNSPLIDLSKLRQSLNAGYEFLAQTKCRVNDTTIDYPIVKSLQYTELCSTLDTSLLKFSPERLREVRAHEIVNYARLLPYKISKPLSSPTVYYCTLILLLNQFWEDYGK